MNQPVSATAPLPSRPTWFPRVGSGDVTASSFDARLVTILREGRRVALGSAGPVAVAIVQFVATMLLWGRVPAAAFGLFSLALVLIQLSFGLSNAVIGTPLAVAPRGEDLRRHRHACLSASALYLAVTGVLVPAIMVLAGAGWNAASLGLLALTANLRWIARSDALAEERIGMSAWSDGGYAIAAALLIGVALALHTVTADSVALGLALAHVVALALFSRPFLARQRDALLHPDLLRYRRDIWPTQASWSVAGVVTTEASSNAHAYFVTWMNGAAGFAPLAFGSLFCRPLSIFLTALTQIDRPAFARHLHAGQHDRIFGLLKVGFIAAGIVWIVNVGVAWAVLTLFGTRIAARGYDVRRYSNDPDAVVCDHGASRRTNPGFDVAAGPGRVQIAGLVQGVRVSHCFP